MKRGRKLPYRLFFPKHISIFDKHIMRSFQNFQYKGRLHIANNMVYYFIEICDKLPIFNDIPYDSSDYSVADMFWFFLYSWYMVVEWHYQYINI